MLIRVPRPKAAQTKTSDSQHQHQHQHQHDRERPRETLKAKEWEYVAEGGANVIFRKAHDSDVLRIPKSRVTTMLPCADILNFAKNKVLPLFRDGSQHHYTVCGDIIELTDEEDTFIRELNDKLARQATGRPVHRLSSKLDETNRQIMRLPDLNTAQLCIELKPKSSLAPETSFGIKQHTCRYCMHQELKCHLGKLERVSSYCPIDLFSNDEQRMATAVHALLEHPQNNLRLFNRSGQAATHRELRIQDQHEFVGLLVELLQQVQILDDLKRAHAYDQIDIEGIWQLHLAVQQLREANDMTSSMQQDITQQHVPCPIRFEQALRTLGHPLERADSIVATADDLESIYENALDKFLLATTMKDCSVLISIRLDNDNGDDNETSLEPTEQQRQRWKAFEHAVKWRGVTYHCVVSIVDLDIKPSSKLLKYYTLDQAIIRHYSESHGLHKRSCFRRRDRDERELEPKRASTVVALKGTMLSRLLYPNPVCLLTVYDPATRLSNVMTLTWLTAIDNQGTFVCSINKRRYTAEFLTVSSVFVLNIPSSEWEETVLAIGSCSGRKVDKFKQFQLETCCPGWSLDATSSTRTRSASFIRHAIVLSDCVAHTVCTVLNRHDHDQHWLLICKQHLAWSREEYFADGKRFRRQSTSVPPYLTFYGSQTFGHVV